MEIPSGVLKYLRKIICRQRNNNRERILLATEGSLFRLVIKIMRLYQKLEVK